MTARIVLAINEPGLAGQAAALAQEGEGIELLDTVSDLDRVVRTLHRAEPDVLVLHDHRGTVPVLELAREIGTTFPEVGVVLILGELAPDVLRTAMQSGARDVVALPLSLEELQLSVRAASAWSRAMRERVTGEPEAATATGLTGRVVAVAGAKGGTGTTTLALHLALAAARAAPERRVAVVDLDLQAGDFRSFLDLPYRRSISDLVEVAEELSVRHLDETLYGHASGLRVLLAPEEGERGEDVTGVVTRNVLTAMRARHELTIVDLGATASDASIAACEIADDVVVVTTPDVLALRGALRLTALWQRLQVVGPRPRVVLNRASRRREVQPDLARRVVGDGLCRTTVPADFTALEAAVNTGMPDRVEERRLREAFGDLVTELELVGPAAEAEAAEPDAEQPAASGAAGLVARLTGERGQSTVETMGLVPVIGLVVLALWQMGLVGYTYMVSGHAAREGARALAVGDDAVGPIRSDVPASWHDGLRCGVGESRVRVSLAIPAVLPGIDSPWRVSSQAGISDETSAVDDIERTVELPEERKDDPCHEDDEDDEDEDEDEDGEDDDEPGGEVDALMEQVDR